MLSLENQKYLRFQLQRAKSHMDRARRSGSLDVAMGEVDEALDCISESLSRLADVLNRRPEMY